MRWLGLGLAVDGKIGPLLRCRTMQEPVDKITISEDDPSVGHTVETELLSSLRKALPQAENTSFALSATDPHGAVVGGLTASTSNGWLLVKGLWVAENHRHQGLGRSLMERAEGKARKIGCHGAWLDTSSPDAMQFYAKLGYSIFGQLDNSAGQKPTTHRRLFMKSRSSGKYLQHHTSPLAPMLFVRG